MWDIDDGCCELVFGLEFVPMFTGDLLFVVFREKTAMTFEVIATANFTVLGNCTSKPGSALDSTIFK